MLNHIVAELARDKIASWRLLAIAASLQGMNGMLIWLGLLLTAMSELHLIRASLLCSTKLNL